MGRDGISDRTIQEGGEMGTRLTITRSAINENGDYEITANIEATPSLKPCPFCGAPARLWKWGMGAHTVVECTNYDVDIHRVSVQGDTEAEAVDAWNRRASDG